MRLISGNIADAEDALSKAMLIAAQKFALYEDQIVNERAWLTCLVHNVCMDHYRSLKRQKGWMAEASIDNSDGMPLACTPSWPSPEDAVAMEESIQALVNVLVSLPDSLRQPLIMRVLQDMPYPEIAERLNITQPAVRKRVQLARERLRKHWSL